MAWAEKIYFECPGFKLDIPKWDFPEHGITCVWGASGSGKSTLLQIMAGLIDAPGFKLSVGGELLSELPARERNFGFVFQDYALFPHMTAWENIAFAAEAKKLPVDIWVDHAEKLLKHLSLERVKNSYARVLSGGEQQRVALARALVTKPRMVLLDEPLSALDENNRDEARSLIAQLSEEYRVPFIFVTHDIRDVRAVSKNLLVLSEGRCVGQNTTNEILNTPESLELARLIPENIILDVSFQNTNCQLAEILLTPKIHRTKSVSSKLIAKNWSFEGINAAMTNRVIASKTNLILKAHILSAHDEGAKRVGIAVLSDRQKVKFWSEIPIGDLKGAIDLQVDPTSLLLLLQEVAS
ncbi:MAG: ATP-binding cassette domain-containing protein [Oligoflexia bacterium]|nr:ATP-binding cassette domain-containing protein [Oligoflexia bacterium]